MTEPSRSADSSAAAPPGAGSPTAIVLLIDESPSMTGRVAGGTKTRAETVATAVNALLRQLGDVPGVEVAMVGYHAAADGSGLVGSRWDGALRDRVFVASREFAAAPVAVEQRVRRVPDPQRPGEVREEQVPFPVWYVPRSGQAATFLDVGRHARQLLDAWPGDGRAAWKAPLVLDFPGDLLGRGPVAQGWNDVQQAAVAAGVPLVFHAHLATMPHVPATLYPSNEAYLPAGPIRELFAASGELPPVLVHDLRLAKAAINEGARGMIYNARLADLTRFMSLALSYARWQPATRVGQIANLPLSCGRSPDRATATTEGLPGEGDLRSAATAGSGDPRRTEGLTGSNPPTALVVLVLDRSIEPSTAEGNHVWQRLQDHANDLLAQIVARRQGRIEVATVAYGGNAAQGPIVETTWPGGPLQGRTFVADTDLAEGAIGVEEVAEQVSNGIGGLVTVRRKKHSWLDLPPAGGTSPRPALAAAAEMLARWQAEHSDRPAIPIVMLLTRACFPAEELRAAVEALHAAGTPVRPVLHALVVSEAGHRAAAYPDAPDAIADPAIAALWEHTSPLLGVEKLAAARRSLSPQSRGLVVGGRFDLLAEGIAAALEKADAPSP